MTTPYDNAYIRNPLIPDSFPLEYEGTTVFVSMSPFMWMRPWEGETAIGLKLSLREHGANAESIFMRWGGCYLTLTMDEVQSRVRNELIHGGLDRIRAASIEWKKVMDDFYANLANEQ